MKVFCKWLLLCLISIQYSYITELTFYVSHYGAYPNDNLDDTKEIQLAINETIRSGPSDDVVFGLGTYLGHTKSS
jgi:hypothetical protein